MQRTYSLLGKPRLRGEVRCLGRKATGRASGDAAAFPCFCFLSRDLRSGLSLRWGSVRALWGTVTPTELGLAAGAGRVLCVLFVSNLLGFGCSQRADICTLEELQTGRGWKGPLGSTFNSPPRPPCEEQRCVAVKNLGTAKICSESISTEEGKRNHSSKPQWC